MLYSSGLRIGELLGVRLAHFDFDRKQLRIEGGKGRKDRYVTIAESIKPLLKNYYRTYMPQVYLIENPKGGKYSASSIRSFLKQSCILAKIDKKVTPHTLRHSYANASARSRKLICGIYKFCWGIVSQRLRCCIRMLPSAT